jgi:hypothetical protein
MYSVQYSKSLKLAIFITAKGTISLMFAKAKCKLCGQSVRFALRHLNQKHPEVLDDKDVAKLKMENIMKKYFA